MILAVVIAAALVGLLLYKRQEKLKKTTELRAALNPNADV